MHLTSIVWRRPITGNLTGFWEGKITTEPNGENGFGYDPIFYVPEKQTTSAQLDKATKNSLSHRGKALKQLLALLQTKLQA